MSNLHKLWVYKADVKISIVLPAIHYHTKCQYPLVLYLTLEHLTWKENQEERYKNIHRTQGLSRTFPLNTNRVGTFK
jgi:hypothetical protein